MCTNQREIKNKYTGQTLYVKCGKCPACLVEKASHRVQKIRNNQSNATEMYLLTLTYARHCAPYVYRSAAFEFSQIESTRNFKLSCGFVLPVYRDSTFRYKRMDSSYNTYKDCVREQVQIGEVPYKHQVSFKGCKDLSHEYEKIGVCWYPDLQDFFKRLRRYLDYRNYDYKFSAYCCSEYGSSSLRPHFHVGLFIPKGTQEIFQAAVFASWPFSDLSKFPRAFEKSFRSSSYLASYVNKPTGFPAFLETYFNTKNSYSKGFGLCNNAFSLRSVLLGFQRGIISYNRQVKENGISRLVTLPVPAYVINRYFPKFKGNNRFTLPAFVSNTTRICRLDYDQNESILGCGADVSYLYDSIQVEDSKGRLVFYNKDDIHKIAVRLCNAWSRINTDYPDLYISSLSDYLELHYKVWQTYSSTVLRLHMENVDIPLYEKYDNLENIKCKIDYNNHSLPIGFTYDMFRVTDPNDFVTTRVRTGVLSKAFHENLYKRKVSHSIYHAVDSQCEL